MPEQLKLQATVQLQAAKGGPTKVRISAYQDQAEMTVGHFGKVSIHLAGMEIPERLPLLLDHDNSVGSIAGSGLPMKSGNELVVVGELASTDAGNMAAELLKAGHPLQASIGAETVKASRDDNDVLQVTKSTLKEVSIVALGAHSETSVAITATQTSEGDMPDKQTDEQLKAQREALLNDHQRVTRILAASSSEEFEGVPNLQARAESAIKAGVTADAFELELRRDARPKFDSFSIRASESASGDTLEAALALHCGLPEASYDEKNLEAGSKLNVTSMIDVARLWCQANGVHAEGTGSEAWLRAAMLKANAGSSTNSFSQIMSNVANKSLLSGYQAYPSVARQIAKKLTSNDFKTQTGVRLNGELALEQVPSNGEIHHGTLGEDVHTWTVDTFGKMITVSRQNLVNDDANALGEIPMLMGRQAATSLETAFWTMFLANAGDFVGVGNGNLLSGAGSALTAAGLGDAVEAMVLQKDSTGQIVDIRPRWMLIPPALQVVADELFVSNNYNATQTGTADELNQRLPAANSFVGKYQPTMTPHLAAANGGDDDQWYLISDDAAAAPYGIAYLGGRTTPMLESADTDFNTLGQQWRCVFDYGVCQLDYRGVVGSAGA